MADDYITKKVPRRLNTIIRRLKAKMSLGGKKITEGEVITLGLMKLEESLENTRRAKLIELAGIAKGVKGVRPEEIDYIVYGD